MKCCASPFSCLDVHSSCLSLKNDYCQAIKAQKMRELVKSKLQAAQVIVKQKHALEGVVAEAGRECGQAAEYLAEHILRVEELEQNV
jgi:hypothetical protein